MGQVSTRSRLREALVAHARISLAHLPTPLDEAPRLSSRLGVRVLIKRDDQTGLALGGNKARKLEYIFADILAAGADTVITTGASQSNHARMTAAAAARLGLACHLVLTRGLHPEPQGNLLLDRLLGATVHLMEESDPDAARRAMDCLADELRRDGHTPFIVPLGGSTPQGALGYAAMVDELLTQLEAAVIRATHLYAVSGSCGMQAGILAGLIAAESPIVVQGISVSHPREQLEPQARDLTVQTLQRLGLEETVPPEKVLIDDRYVGPDYGIPTPGMIEALEIVARDEGVILDPVYTGKAMAGLIDHARQGLVGADDTVVFLHSGGLPGLFAYAQEFDRQLGAMPALTR